MSPRLFAFVLAVFVLAAPARAQFASAAAPDGGTFGGGGSSFARPAPVDDAPIYYAIRDAAELRAMPTEDAPAEGRLAFREGVRVLAQEGAWSLVQQGRRRGYVPTDALSNVWLRVDKSDRQLYVYRGAELVRTLPADVSMSDEDKERRSALGERDHYRIPEGTFFVVARNDRSQYHRAFVLNYPNQEDAARGLRDGLINSEEYADIVKADLFGEAPPMGTALGGMIEIHGDGSGRQRAWTRGCVALRNVHMDDLWLLVEVGTPVVVEP